MTEVSGFHHAGIVTRDLDGLARRYTELGFTVSPHSRHLLGAGPGEPTVPGRAVDRCVLFGDSSIELLGIVDESAPDPWHTRAMIERYEGLRLLNLETADAVVSAERLAAAGLRTSGVLDLARDVDTEDGVRTVRAKAVRIDPRSTPEGFLGLAQHRTRDHVHRPRSLVHDNGARGIGAVLIVASEDAFDAIVDRYVHILELPPYEEGPLTLLRTGPVHMEFVRAADAEKVLPGEPVPADSYLAAMTIRVADAAEARDIVEDHGIPIQPTGDGFFVSARDACGAGLFFTG
ncbi:VOC family protein [Nocardia sp. NBC_01377]|uniref:VOC family protein n=1 Tax=Nocardia sp. NBC_01377 TaxID=2903595 RepID=UPI00324F6D31